MRKILALSILLVLSIMARVPAYAQLPTYNMNITGTASQFGGTLDCTKFSASGDMSQAIAACLVALNSISTTGGIADATGFTGNQTWSENPFSAAGTPGTNFPWTGELRVCTTGTITLNVPIVQANYWRIVGCGTAQGAGSKSAAFTAHSGTFQATYTTGTVTMGTPGQAEVITGSGTTWTASMIGCAFVSPSTQPTATNSTFGIIHAVGSNTSLTLGYGANNGSGAPASSSYAIYCPMLLMGGDATGAGSPPAEYTGIDEHISLTCNNIAGCVDAMNWYGEEGTDLVDATLTGYTNIGYDVESNYAQNSTIGSKIILQPGSSCTSGTISVEIRTGAVAVKPFKDSSINNPFCSTQPTVGIDVQGSNIRLENLHLENYANGISVSQNTSCPVACPQPPTQSVMFSAEHINAASTGTNVINLGNTGGSLDGAYLSDVTESAGSTWTNVLSDSADSCTDTATRIGSYLIRVNGGIQASTSTTTSCKASPLFNTVTAASTVTLSSITGLTQCLHVNSSGVVSGTGSDCGSGGGGGVTSLTGDGTIITNSASTGAVTLTIAGTSGGIPYFSSSTAWASSAALTANSPVLGGGAGTAPKTVAGITSDGVSVLTLGVASTSAGGIVFHNTSTGAITLSPVSGALGTVTASLPANTGTIAELNLAETWSALQTYSAGINLSGTTSPLQLAGSAGTSGNCMLSGGAGATPSWGSCSSGSVLWSAIGNPTGNLALTMAADTSTFTYNASTGSSDLFKLTDTTSNIGTGIMMHITTASGSSETPWQADANGVGWKVDTSGNFDNVGSSVTGAINISGGTSGTAVITVQSAAGTPTVTLGTNSGTPAVTASSPLVITTATGNIACATCLTSAASITNNQAVNGLGSQALIAGFSDTAGTITSGDLACYTASNTIGNCTIAANNILGVFNTATTWIASGETTVNIDTTQTVTFGDILCVSGTSASVAHDNGNISCTTGEWVGIVKTTAASVTSATAFVVLR